jgi:hypothetical protein
MPAVIVPYRRDHELRQARGEVLFLAGSEACLVEKNWRALGGAGAFSEEIMRASCWHRLKEIGEAVKSVVFGARAQQG